MSYQFFKNRFFSHKKLILQFIKFCIVGTLGMIIDIGFLNLLHKVFNLNVYFSATISFILAVINNFLLNRHWTFKGLKMKEKSPPRQFTFFVMVSIIGLGINLGIMWILIESFNLWYNWAKVIAILIVTLWNFLANKFWTFREQREV